MLSFKRYNPQRRLNDVHPLASIPNEIYLEIFSYISPKSKATWVNMFQVCSFFHNMCLPKAFEEIAWNCANPPQRQKQFYQALVQNNPLAMSVASHIKRCTVFDYNRHSCTNHLYVDAFMFALAHMSHLHTLTVQTIFITPGVLQAISRLKALKKLVLANVDPGMQPLSVQRVKDLEGLTRLESFECITSYPFPPGSHPDLASSLCTIIMQKPLLRRLALHYWEAASRFLQMQIDEQVNIQLESLQLYEVQDPSLVAKFLIKSPSLQELSIQNGPPPCTSALPLTALPVLHTLQCPPTWVDPLLGGGAVRKTLRHLDIHPSWVMAPLSDAWTSGNLDIDEKMSIPFDWAAHWLPLRKPRTLGFNSAQLDPPEVCEKIERIGDEHTVFENVEVVEINDCSTPSVLERHHIVSITNKFPRVSIIRVGRMGEWARPADTDDEWRWQDDAF